MLGGKSESYRLSSVRIMSRATMNSAIAEAYEVLEGRKLEREQAEKLSMLKGADILDLVSLANKVRERFAHRVHVCTIMNAQSGRCSEDCKFCSQSSHHCADIEEYPLVDRYER